MSDPFEKAAAHELPVVGQGCLARYDPEALQDSDGTAFEGAQALWQALTSQVADREGKGTAPLCPPASVDETGA